MKTTEKTKNPTRSTALWDAQKQIRENTVSVFHKRPPVKNAVVGKLYFHLPEIGTEGWVHGRRLVCVKVLGDSFVKLQCLETGKKFTVTLNNIRNA